MKVTHRVQVAAEAPNQGITGKQLKEFAALIPDEAVISATMRDRGSQRDPEPYLYALNAVWETPS